MSSFTASSRQVDGFVVPTNHSRDYWGCSAKPELTWNISCQLSTRPLEKGFFKNTNWTQEAERCQSGTATGALSVVALSCHFTYMYLQSCDSYNADLRFRVRASSLEAVCQITCSFLCNLKRLYTIFFTHVVKAWPVYTLQCVKLAE